ncbi:MAG: ABC transporter permease, partial [Bacteroidales bacterium]|nr:ABC transporter permease [Bacteroidales bacterium]
MNVYRFIGDRIRKCRIDGKGRHISSLSSKIGTVSVAVSIAVIIVAVSVVMGFRREISDKTSGFMGQLSLVAPGQTPMNEQYPFTDSISYLGQIEELASVSGLSRVAYRSGLFKTDDNIFGVCLKGVDSLYNMSFFEEALQKGALPNLRGRVSSDILISGRLAAQMRCDVGDGITAYFVGEDVKVRKFRVCGLFDAQLEDLDNTMVLCDLRQVQRLNGWSGDEVSTIEIRL